MPYAGQSTNYNNLREDELDFGVGAKVVLNLSKSIDSPQRSAVFFDNFFTGVKLVAHLKKEYNLLSVGTLRQDRTELCPLLSDKNLKSLGRGSYDTKIHRNGVQVIKWLDNKCVHLASTLAGTQPEGKVKRWDKKERAKVDVPTPRAFELYNKNMGGVDLHDMLVQLNRLPTRARRWYVPLIGYMIDLSLVNSWLLYRRHGASLSKPARLESKEFRLAVSKSLRGAPKQPPQKSPKNVIKEPRGYRPDLALRFEGQHSPVFEAKQARCKLCTDGKTKVKCPKCQVYLCFTPNRNCFMTYHLPVDGA
ncbi:PiggyBac transposable element-derived protein 3 [Frankliniella fusca]|uniref:PiggyBac transposable element-derived protein 3 n=1 Tax=Frankliniella fusca TaxID=407009 RepID=A0AAE1I5A4_9NEOP|nr:PiggyBac transposable element-derived protein 3 [Frankliniella fusca]